MEPILRAMLNNLREKKSHMVEQLHQFCEINSGTENLTGLDRMRQVISEAFAPIADNIITYPSPSVEMITMRGDTVYQNVGDMLYIRKRPDVKRRLLLVGHMDTVFDEQHSFQSLTYLDDQHINGPGVTDMKGGLIVMLHALSAFETLPHAENIGWDVFINADEETGSFASAKQLANIAFHYDTAFVYEPATNLNGDLAKNRKGSGKFTLIAHGRAAHAGRAFHDGRNAICYLAEVLLSIHALNDQRKGVTINVGKIAGGDALNVVPEKAVAKLDIRIESVEDGEWVRAQLKHVLDTHTRTDYHLELHGHFHRPPKSITPKTQQLFERIQYISNTLGFPLDWQNSGGCCDGNNLSQHGLAVLDTLGVRGGNIHSSDEFIVIDSLVERSALSALLLDDYGRR